MKRIIYAKFPPADVPVAEEELAGEVALLDDVIISHRQPPARAGHPHERKVLQELAAAGQGGYTFNLLFYFCACPAFEGIISCPPQQATPMSAEFFRNSQLRWGLERLHLQISKKKIVCVCVWGGG